MSRESGRAVHGWEDGVIIFTVIPQHCPASYFKIIEYELSMNAR